MSIERRNFPQFFITAASPCPYVRGRMERKVFTHLVGPDARALNTHLSQGGFRRSQNIAYRPACDACSSCESVRVPVGAFKWSRSFKRVLARNRDISATVVKAQATSEHYSLFRGYIDDRHGEGGMADMSVLDFAAMVDDTLVECRIVEYRLPSIDGEQGELVAAVLVDILSDGISMIYSFYEPQHMSRSLGTFMVLDMLRRVERMGLPYLYLGYYVRESQKMSYKGRFLPQERLSSQGWKTVSGT